MSTNQPITQVSRSTSVPTLGLWHKLTAEFDERLGRTELRRRLWHMSPGLLPFVLWPIPHKDPLGPLLFGALIVVTFGLAFGCYRDFQSILREGEAGTRKSSSVLGYALPVLATLLLLPAHLEVGFAVLAVLAFGDGSATLGGKLLRGPKLPWNSAKSWSGFCCFLLIGIPMVAVIYWGETHNLAAMTPGVTFSLALLIATCAVTVAAIVESLPTRLNDNISVGITAVVMLTTCHFLWVV